jgi:hypothetical protein
MTKATNPNKELVGMKMRRVEAELFSVESSRKAQLFQCSWDKP